MLKPPHLLATTSLTVGNPTVPAGGGALGGNQVLPPGATPGGTGGVHQGGGGVMTCYDSRGLPGCVSVVFQTVM
jgi:hypothetical protein